MYPIINFHQTNRLEETQINDIEKAISGEYNAIQCYQKLANLAHSSKEREQILEIQRDEMKHYKLFTQIFVQLTGKNPRIQLKEECPNTYKAGLEYAIKDEQETVDFYHDISDKATDPMIKQAFTRVAADEQNHAVWFLYFFTKRIENKFLKGFKKEMY